MMFIKVVVVVVVLNYLWSKNIDPESNRDPLFKDANITVSLLWLQSLNLKSKQLYC